MIIRKRMSDVSDLEITFDQKHIMRKMLELRTGTI